MSLHKARPPLLFLPVAGLAGCAGQQSALSPTGVEAERVAFLFWIMTAFGTAILIGVMVLAAVAIIGGEARRRWLARENLIIGGGIVFPVVTLSVLLVFGLYLMGGGPAAAIAEDTLRVRVVGERWWWRVEYLDAQGRRFESANELRIPVGRPVAIELTTADVIHSFWAPTIAGKLDMIPGRTNVLTVSATEPGVSRGQCAEYCGGAHALMSFYVVAMDEAAFQAWLAQEAGPAREPRSGVERRGRGLFFASGCQACHAIRGTDAEGRIGPDLTHVGGRMSLAAATLPNDPESLARWISDNQHIKPDNLMPPFEILSEDDLSSLATYLASLK